MFFALMLAMAAQADVLSEYSFVGTLGDKIPVRLKFAVNGDEIAVGEIFYPKAKNPAPILVVGAPTEDGWYYLKEYQSDGTITGTMLFRIEEDENEEAHIAEGQSAPDRPAVLGESTHDYFNYENVNDCGYGFSAHFFKKFVVLKTTTKYDTLGCFGMGVAFDGVYIKVKQ